MGDFREDQIIFHDHFMQQQKKKTNKKNQSKPETENTPGYDRRDVVASQMSKSFSLLSQLLENNLQNAVCFLNEC